MHSAILVSAGKFGPVGLFRVMPESVHTARHGAFVLWSAEHDVEAMLCSVKTDKVAFERYVLNKHQACQGGF
jgi:hypothetical protein